MTDAIFIGCDGLSGTDSSEALRVFAPGTVNPDWVRVQINWPAVETAPGAYNWTAFDRQIAANTISNYTSGPCQGATQPKLMLNVYGCPAFYKTQTSFIAGECSLIRAAMLRYPGRFWAAEPLNEPYQNWMPECKAYLPDTAILSAHMVIAVRATVKTIDPTALIAGPSLTSPYDDNWFSIFAVNGGFDALDMVTLHDYRMGGSGVQPPPPEYSPSQPIPGQLPLAGCIANCNRYAPGKPVFTTEWGPPQTGDIANAVAYAVIAQRSGIAGLTLGHSWGGYGWDFANTNLFPASRAFLDTIRALNQTP